MLSAIKACAMTLWSLEQSSIVYDILHKSVGDKHYETICYPLLQVVYVSECVNTPLVTKGSLLPQEVLFRTLGGKETLKGFSNEP